MRIRKFTLLISFLIVTCAAFCAGCRFTVNGEVSSTIEVDNITPLVTSSVSENASDYHITIMGLRGIKIYITDPQGRHLGIAPTSQEIVIEIPGASFENNPIWEESARGDATEEPEQLVIAHIPDPTEGLYQIQTFGMLEPSGGGLGLSVRKGNGEETRRLVQIDSEQTMPIEYQFTYSLEDEELITELVMIHNEK